MKREILTVVSVILVVMFFSVVVYGVVVSLLRVGGSGVILNGNIDLRENGVSVTSVQWGNNLVADEVVQKTFQLYNLMNLDVTVFMTHTLSSGVGSFSWDSEGTVISVGGYVDVTFTLTVASNPIEGAFNFDITLSAEV